MVHVTLRQLPVFVSRCLHLEEAAAQRLFEQHGVVMLASLVDTGRHLTTVIDHVSQVFRSYSKCYLLATSSFGLVNEVQGLNTQNGVVCIGSVHSKHTEAKNRCSVWYLILSRDQPIACSGFSGSTE